MIREIAIWSYELLGGIPSSIRDPIFIIMLAIALFQVCAIYAMFGGLLERKVIARVHSRVGPMYTGPRGILQTAADALKFLRKEIIFPIGSDRLIFAAAPLIMMLPAFLTFVFLPIGGLFIVNSTYSLVIVLALLSISPIAMLLGSWASNNKFSTLGGLRAAGMAMSYEALLALSVASIMLTTGSLSIGEIVAFQAQHGVWLAFLQPVAFVLFMIAILASVERNPFDLTEAESELVGGWKTEYGGVYFSLTLFAEYAKLLASILLCIALFMGGASDFGGDFGFLIKVFVLTVLMFYARATSVRFRLEQLLQLVWSRLVSLALANVAVTIIVLRMGAA